jgi:glycosyltransferase involved in cell wall biosynthesis
VLVLLTTAQGEYLRAEEGFGSRPWRRTRIALIPNGIDIPPPATGADRARARRALGVGPDEEVVGILAALRPEKDHETLLRAVARLAPSRPRLRLVLVGSGAREESLRAEAARLGVEGRTVFAGFRTDAVALLPAFDVKCLVSVQETFPTSVLEAMAAGVPVVMTATPGVPDLVGDGVAGYRVPVGDDAALADRLAALLDDPATRARMGAAARERAARDHPISRTIDRYAQVFRSIAGRDGTPG